MVKVSVLNKLTLLGLKGSGQNIVDTPSSANRLLATD